MNQTGVVRVRALGAVSKLGFWFKFKAEPSFKPQALLYVEDLKRGTNAEIGTKDNLETAPSVMSLKYP